MSTDGYRHIHHIISAKPLPLLDPNDTNDALHYTQTIDDDSTVIMKDKCFVFSFKNLFFLILCFFFKTPRNPGLLHRRVHLNDLPEYLISGASKQFLLHRTRSPSISSTSQYDDSSGFFAINQNNTPRTYTSVINKRNYDDELSYSNKRHLVTERIIPVEHQHAQVVYDQKPLVGNTEVVFFFSFC